MALAIGGAALLEQPAGDGLDAAPICRARQPGHPHVHGAGPRHVEARGPGKHHRERLAFDVLEFNGQYTFGLTC